MTTGATDVSHLLNVENVIKNRQGKKSKQVLISQ